MNCVPREITRDFTGDPELHRPELPRMRFMPRMGADQPDPDICIVSLNYPPEPTGIASYTGGLAAGLAAAGHSVAVQVSHPHYPEWKIYDGYGRWHSTEQVDGVRVQRRLHYVPQPPRGVRRLISELSFGLRLMFARWGSPRVVIALSPPLFSTALAAIRVRLTPRRARLIIWVQDIYSLGLAETGEGGRSVQRITRWVEKYTLRAADRIVVIHQRFADFMTHELGVAPSKVEIIRNWTHLEPSSPVDASAAKVALGWPREMTLAVHTGNMGTKQGLENIVDAARIADDIGAPVHFLLVGDGGERRRLEHYAKGVERLTFVDPLSDEEYRLALGAADVLLVNEKPGVSAMAMPSKLTSYFDAGRPVIAATDPDGITASEIMAAGAGLVVRAADAHALLSAVLALREDADAAALYAVNSQRYREAMLGERAAIEHWESVITTAEAPPPARDSSPRP